MRTCTHLPEPDDAPEPLHPEEQSLLETVECEMDRELDIAAATNAVLLALERIRRREDEEMGVALAARFDNKETA